MGMIIPGNLSERERLSDKWGVAMCTERKNNDVQKTAEEMIRAGKKNHRGGQPVSYTHLTLPTKA